MKLNEKHKTSVLRYGNLEALFSAGSAPAHGKLKCNSPVPRIRSSSATEALFVMGSGLLALSLLGLTLFASFVLNEPISTFTRDPMAVAHGRPYYGFISNAGAVIWSFSAAICLFSYWVLPRDIDRSDSLRRFILLGGLISAILLGDDLFMLHESVYPYLFSVPEEVVFSVYGLLLLFYVLRFWSIIRKTEYLLLILSGFFFGVSIGVDRLPEDLLAFHHLFEDGAKLFGIVSWLGYQLSVCTSAVRCSQQRSPSPDPGEPLLRQPKPGAG